jgi:hypothetical protein
LWTIRTHQYKTEKIPITVDCGKSRQIFDVLSSKFSELPSNRTYGIESLNSREGHLSAVHSKNTKRFGIQIYKLCDRSDYTFDKRMYQGKQRNMASTDFTPSHGMAQELIRKVAELGTKYS